MPSHYGGITPEDLVSKIRSANPGIFDDLNDTQLFKYILSEDPKWSEQLVAGSASSLSPFQAPSQAAVIGSTAGLSRQGESAGFFKQLTHNLRRHVEETPSMAMGMLGWLSADPEQKDILIKKAESWRRWSEDQLINQLENDPKLLAHYQWVKDTPFSFDNLFSSTGFDLVQRGIASGLPSILEMILLSKGTGMVMRATGLAAKGGLAARMSPRIVTVLGMTGLEGSQFYNEGMRNLVDEGGMTPTEALEEIGPLTAVVAPLIGISEYLPFGKILNKMGMQKLSQKQLMKTMASKLRKGWARTAGKEAIIGAIAEGSQEWGQNMIQEMGAHSYRNGYGNSPAEALGNFFGVLSDNWSTPEAKEEFFVGTLMGFIMRGGAGAMSAPTPKRVAKFLKTQQENIDAAVRLKKFTEAQGKELFDGYKKLATLAAVDGMEKNDRNEFINKLDVAIDSFSEKGTITEKISGAIEKVKSLIPTRKAKEDISVGEPEIDYTQYKVPELRKMAKEAGIKGYSGLNKTQLIEKLSAEETYSPIGPISIKTRGDKTTDPETLAGIEAEAADRNIERSISSGIKKGKSAQTISDEVLVTYGFLSGENLAISQYIRDRVSGKTSTDFGTWRKPPVKEAESIYEEVSEEDAKPVTLKDKDMRKSYISSIADENVTDFLDKTNLTVGVIGEIASNDAKITKPSMKLLSLISKDRNALKEILAHKDVGKLLMLAGDALNEHKDINIDLTNSKEIIDHLKLFAKTGSVVETTETIVPGEIDTQIGGGFVPQMEIKPQDTEIPIQEHEIGGTKTKEELAAEAAEVESKYPEIVKKKKKDYPAPAWEVNDIVQLNPKVKRKTGLSPDVDYKVERVTPKMVFLVKPDGKGAQIGVYKNEVVGDREIVTTPSITPSVPEISALKKLTNFIEKGVENESPGKKLTKKDKDDIRSQVNSVEGIKDVISQLEKDLKKGSSIEIRLSAGEMLPLAEDVLSELLEKKKRADEYFQTPNRVQFPPSKEGEEPYALVDGKKVILSESQKSRLLKIGEGKDSKITSVQGAADAMLYEMGEELIAQQGTPPETGSLQKKMTKEIASVISPGAAKAGYLHKEQVKTGVATQFIGEGKSGSSTDRYRGMYSKEGLANTGKYTKDDVIFIASNGRRARGIAPVKGGNLQGEYKNIDAAIAAGSDIIMDTVEYASKSYNTGEQALAKYLLEHGYERVGTSGLWKKAAGQLEEIVAPDEGEEKKTSSRETIAQRKKRLKNEMNTQNEENPPLDTNQSNWEEIKGEQPTLLSQIKGKTPEEQDKIIEANLEEIPSQLSEGTIKTSVTIHLSLMESVGKFMAGNEIGITKEEYNNYITSENKGNVINGIVDRMNATTEDSDNDTQNEIDGDISNTENDAPPERGADDGVQNLQEVGAGPTSLIAEEPETAEKLAKRLHKKFGKKLGISVKAFEGTIMVHGVEAVGSASLHLVSWSLTDGTLDTLPHEYAHIYVELLADTPIIKLGIKKFTKKGMSLEKAKEALVQHIGEYYVERMDKSLIGKFKVWLKQFVNRLKNRIFGGADKKTKAEIGDYIAEQFYLSIGLEKAGMISDFLAAKPKSKDEADTATSTKFNEIPSDIYRRESYNKMLQIYIRNEDFAQVAKLAQDSDTFEKYISNLMKWAKKYSKTRVDRSKNLKKKLSKEDKESMRVDWLKMKSRIFRYLTGEIGNAKNRKGDDTRPLLMFTFDKKNGNKIKIAPITHPVTGKSESESFTVNFFEKHFLDGLHKMRLISLPIRNIIKHVTYNDKSRNPVSGKITVEEKSFDTSYNLEVTDKTILEMDNVAAEDFIHSIVNGNNIEDTIKNNSLLSSVSSKTGDNATIYFVAVPSEYKDVTQQQFKDFVDEELKSGNLGAPKSQSAKDRANKLYKSGTYAIKKDNAWNKYLDMSLREIQEESLDFFASDEGVARATRLKKGNESVADASVRLMRQDISKKMAFKLRKTIPMSRTIAVHKWWQAAETSDYLVHQKSVADSYDRLSIPMAEGFNPHGMRDTKFMSIDDNVKMTVEVNGEEVNAGVYNDTDGALLTGGRWFHDVADITGVPLNQIKTFIHHKDYEDNGDSFDLVQMKHMQFVAFKKMRFYSKSGELIAESRGGGRLMHFVDMRTNSPTFGEKFDIIGSQNEMKRTRGKYADKYQVHSIPYTAVKVHSMMQYTATSGAHPFAFGEYLLDPSMKDNPIVKNLIEEIRKNYGVSDMSNPDNAVDRYINRMLELRDSPKALYDFLLNEKALGQLDTNLDKLLDSVGENGEGVHHPSIMLEAIPMINASLLRDGLFKARSARGYSTRTYLRPSYHLDIDEGLGFISSDNDNFTIRRTQTAYLDWWNKHQRKKGEKKRTFKSWNIEKHDLIQRLNAWLEEKDANGEYKNNVWFLIHRQPIQKAGGVLLRRVQRIHEGNLGKTSMLSKGDVQWLLDGDWDGDTIFLEDITDGYANAMREWQYNTDSPYHTENKTVSLDILSNRVDKPINEEDKTSMASYSDRVSVMSSVAKSTGGTGLTVNAKVIFMQLASKGLKIYSEDPQMEGIYFEPYAPTDAVVMDYLPIEKQNLTKKEIDIVIQNGDSIVYYDNDGNQFTVNLEKIKDEIESLGDAKFYLRTTKQHEFSMLFQMAVDSNKYKLWGSLKWNKGLLLKVGGDREFLISRMWKRSDGKPLSAEKLKNDYATLGAIQSIQNVSRIRQGLDKVGSASFIQNLENSELLSLRYYDIKTGKKLSKEEIGENYINDFIEKTKTNARFSGWVPKKVETNGFITPGEELVASIGKKWISIDREASQGGKNSIWGSSFLMHADEFLRLAHVETANRLFQNINKTVMGATLKQREDAMQFLTKERETQVAKKVYNKETKEMEEVLVTEKTTFFEEFRELYREWDLQRKSSELGIIKTDYSDTFIDFREKYIKEYMNLPSLTKAWTSLIFLKGIGEVEFITRFLPTDFMDKGILKKYFKYYEDTLQGLVGTEQTYGERETGKFRTDVASNPETWAGYTKFNSELSIMTQERAKKNQKIDEKIGLCIKGK